LLESLFYDVFAKKVDGELVKTLSASELQFSFEKLAKGLYFCNLALRLGVSYINRLYLIMFSL